MAWCVKTTFPTKNCFNNIFSKALHCTIPRRTILGDSMKRSRNFLLLYFFLQQQYCPVASSLSCTAFETKSLRLLVFCTKVLLLLLAMGSTHVRYTTLQITADFTAVSCLPAVTGWVRTDTDVPKQWIIRSTGTWRKTSLMWSHYMFCPIHINKSRVHLLLMRMYRTDI